MAIECLKSPQHRFCTIAYCLCCKTSFSLRFCASCAVIYKAKHTEEYFSRSKYRSNGPSITWYKIITYMYPLNDLHVAS